MKWVLIWIALNNHAFHTISEFERYDTMEECFEARNQLVERVGRPIINYQAVCVQYDKDRLFTHGQVQPK